MVSLPAIFGFNWLFWKFARFFLAILKLFLLFKTHRNYNILQHSSPDHLQITLKQKTSAEGTPSSGQLPIDFGKLDLPIESKCFLLVNGSKMPARTPKQKQRCKVVFVERKKSPQARLKLGIERSGGRALITINLGGHLIFEGRGFNLIGYFGWEFLGKMNRILKYVVM